VRNVYLDCCQVQDRVQRRTHSVGGGLAATSRYRAVCVSALSGASVRDRRAGRRTCEEQRPISGYWFLPGGKRATRRIHGSARGSSCSSLVEKSRVSRTRSRPAEPSSVKGRPLESSYRQPVKSHVCTFPEAFAIVRDRYRIVASDGGMLAVPILPILQRGSFTRAHAVFREECDSRRSARAVNSTVFR